MVHFGLLVLMDSGGLQHKGMNMMHGPGKWTIIVVLLAQVSIIRIPVYRFDASRIRVNFESDFKLCVSYETYNAFI